MRSVALLLLVGLDAHDAAACGASVPDTFMLDPAYRDDTSPPSPPSVSATARLSTGTDCGDFVIVSMEVSTTDDRAPSERIGYIIDMESPATTAPTGSLHRYFPADSPSFTKQFSVRAVDLNGNTSEPSLVDIAYEAPSADDGCNVAGSPGFALALLVLARCKRWRRSRPIAASWGR